MNLRPLSIALATLAVAACALPGATAHAATVSNDPSYTGNGKLTWYDDQGYGACGSPINAATQMLVAVARTYWTAANPNTDPLCGKYVVVTYHGRTLKLPIRDQCAGCAPNQIDLSKPAFANLADLGTGTVTTASWKIVSS